MDELRKLQEEFRKLQQQDSVRRLSERNCREIILKLIEIGKMQVFFTTNGKEYVTPLQLEKEIQDELYVRRGRVSLLDLYPIVNIDLHHIEKKVEEMCKKDKDLQIVHGELISGYYLTGVVQEINEALQEAGELTVSDLAKRFGLATDFLERVIAHRLGKTLNAHMEDGRIYTKAFIFRQKAVLRGIFSAVTKPTSLQQIFTKFSLNHNLCYALFDELLAKKEIKGSIQGRLERATYIPSIYSITRERWLNDFWKQNHCISYDTLAEIHIPDPRKYLISHYGNEGLPLQTCFIGLTIRDQLDAEIAEALSSNSWMDITSRLPTALSSADASLVLHECPSFKVAEGVLLLRDTIILSKGFLDKLLQLFKDNVEESLKLHPLSLDNALKEEEEDEPEVKGRGKRGATAKQSTRKRGNVQTSGKGKKSGGAKTDILSYMITELKKWLRPQESRVDDWDEEEFPEELLPEVASHFRSQFEDMRLEAARAASRQTSQAVEGQRLKLNSLKEQIQLIYPKILLFHSSLLSFVKDNQKLLDDKVEEFQQNLERHLLRTHGAELLNLLVFFQAHIHRAALPGDENNKIDPIKLTAAERSELIDQLPPKESKCLLNLNKLVGAKSVEAFLVAVEKAETLLGVKLKKVEKKKERQMVFVLKQAMQQQIQEETEPAVLCHLATAFLFLKITNRPLHFPARVLPTILSILQPQLPAATYDTLYSFYQKVVEYLNVSRTTNEDEESSEPSENALINEKTSSSLLEELYSRMNGIKQLTTEPATDSSS